MSFLAKTSIFGNIYKFAPVSGVLSRLYSSEVPQFETLAITVPKKHVFHVELNRPKQLNSITSLMWKELKDCFESLNENSECRVVLLSARGKHFTAGIDFNSLLEENSKAEEHEDVARKAKIFEKLITHCQDGITSLERCNKPILAVVHSACVGAGVDLITAADVRYCTQDAWFQVKEVDVGLAADVGTLQRLPKVVGNTSTVRELCFTARRFDSQEASELGLVSRVYSDQESAIKNVLETAVIIASKSPVAVQNTKKSLVYSQSRPNEVGLEHIKLINQAMLQSEDLKKAAIAQATKSTTEYENL
ncbi:delta(3,5)-Delta(2,4)-dienoyl-CoA isomerase, mitochondrial isoform X1 [Danaus plexippus]|uniref:delta(3,5)-Delta(2,4)-dienoyl-CoA isomerase, mitochondrial isoform X1 n=1 Tax=Danaus plexippus TaxID=13037 RepID=UPI000C870D1B|nr:delta(3,5)-Delta(2,4)-dienoyl-CoA isomerase, mitochondrial isoform X1 [Danaus plexippus]